MADKMAEIHADIGAAKNAAAVSGDTRDFLQANARANEAKASSPTPGGLFKETAGMHARVSGILGSGWSKAE